MKEAPPSARRQNGAGGREHEKKGSSIKSRICRRKAAPGHHGQITHQPNIKEPWNERKVKPALVAEARAGGEARRQWWRL